tara:strand:+ start:188 stop:355 length:168 start_codon:yes stop_codon:yes gene_type:complete
MNLNEYNGDMWKTTIPLSELFKKSAKYKNTTDTTIFDKLAKSKTFVKNKKQKKTN